MTGSGEETTATVVIPSYGRPESLRACLDAVLGGSRLPEQVIVVLRDTDGESHQALRAWLSEAGDAAGRVESARVSRPGQSWATNRGLERTRGDVVCFIDDDCRPTEEWLDRLMRHYQDPGVVGVGGRDIVHHGDTISARPSRVVGRLTWWGRVTGNHHQPAGDEPREVDHLKGANMSFRRRAGVRFDPNLLGAHLSDTDASLSARRHGRLIYDPLAAVHHYPAPRPHGYQRSSTSFDQLYADAHDWSYVMHKHLSPGGRAAFVAWALMVGQDRRYGLLKALAALPLGPRAALRRWWATVRGVLAGRAAARRAASSASDHRGREPSHVARP